MRVFVAGDTGAIGNHAVPALIAADTVTALARTPEKAAVLANTRRFRAGPLITTLRC